MSETVYKTPRTLNEIQAEYQALCMKAGNLKYQINVLESDLGIVLGGMKDLSFEAAASQTAAQKQQQAAAAAPQIPAAETKEEAAEKPAAKPAKAKTKLAVVEKATAPEEGKNNA